MMVSGRLIKRPTRRGRNCLSCGEALPRIPHSLLLESTEALVPLLVIRVTHNEIPSLLLRARRGLVPKDCLPRHTQLLAK
jgi:hypothetical protein